jgi:3-deoxy-D-manno-octulosonic-acid transferase
MYWLYRFITYCLWPALRVLPFIRLHQGKEVVERLYERFGKPTQLKTSQNVIWFHGASNGESLSALPLIHHMIETHPDAQILITTMTKTGAELMQKRLGEFENVVHQFIPYDQPAWVHRFHEYWQPSQVFWVESELWPNHLHEIKRRNIPAILINARLSDNSVRGWRKANAFFKSMMSTFHIVLAQTHRDANNLKSLGLNHAQCVGNLKDLTPALPFDPIAADDIRVQITSRPCVLFSSTHAPEEDMACRIHAQLKQAYPDLLSIIIPRHPKRGDAIAEHAAGEGFNVARRSLKMSPRLHVDIYVADTLGETGLFYHLCPIVFVGNSMGTKPGGGHNLLEPAWFDCAILSGDDLHNFSVQADEMPTHNACVIAGNEGELALACLSFLQDANRQTNFATNALDYVREKQKQGLGNILTAIGETS